MPPASFEQYPRALSPLMPKSPSLLPRVVLPPLLMLSRRLVICRLCGYFNWHIWRHDYRLVLIVNSAAANRHFPAPASHSGGYLVNQLADCGRVEDGRPLKGFRSDRILNVGSLALREGG